MCDVVDLNPNVVTILSNVEFTGLRIRTSRYDKDNFILYNKNKILWNRVYFCSVERELQGMLNAGMTK